MMMVMYLLLPVTMTACVIQLYLNLSVELMVLPTSHPAKRAATYTSIRTSMYDIVKSVDFVVSMQLPHNE